MKKYKIVNSLNIGDVLIQTIIWVVLTLCTFGLALPFFIYYFFKLILNTTEIYELECTYDEFEEAIKVRKRGNIHSHNDAAIKKKNADYWSK
ncbi:DUF6693 family protein [Aliivibrio fischeri]|uniref:DUF6693 family protein n=1 Tax=Aliivibrio fischeri TaxID=668 RepID=UPI0009081684|nr:DUF6693 family protein [Aliivibrio fischeri]